MEKPSIRFSNMGSIASGVTSRPVKPVPPVVMIASTPGSAIHLLTMMRIASTSSTMISRAARLCPAAVSRSASVVPDLSSASERVSEIVNTAMLSGTNCLVSSIEDMTAPLLVMPGLVPGINVLQLRKSKDMDGRDEPGHDDPCLSTMVQRSRAKRIAGLHAALLIAGHEPLLSLRGGTVRERVRHHSPGGPPLQRIVADRGRRRQRR